MANFFSSTPRIVDKRAERGYVELYATAAECGSVLLSGVSATDRGSGTIFNADWPPEANPAIKQYVVSAQTIDPEVFSGCRARLTPFLPSVQVTPAMLVARSHNIAPYPQVDPLAGCNPPGTTVADSTIENALLSFQTARLPDRDLIEKVELIFTGSAQWGNWFPDATPNPPDEPWIMAEYYQFTRGEDGRPFWFSDLTEELPTNTVLPRGFGWWDYGFNSQLAARYKDRYSVRPAWADADADATAYFRKTVALELRDGEKQAKKSRLTLRFRMAEPDVPQPEWTTDKGQDFPSYFTFGFDTDVLARQTAAAWDPGEWYFVPRLRVWYGTKRVVTKEHKPPKNVYHRAYQDLANRRRG